ncbi:MAG: glutamine synthetase family protein [Bacteroidetes bacterium]|nr:glutamine synthetase family protein [Bacteroidota bacterium]MBU1720185.1 glutamine synthetase family protein [Bacteroidota bacterium]
MKKDDFTLNPHAIVRFLQKSAAEFTKEDLVSFIVENEIEMVNFRYVGGDGKLKTLNFVINGLDHLNRILSTGERVDGSSLFSYVEAESSDLYVVPRYSTAFLNPFSEIPAVDILCSYFNKDGEPLASSPENILRKAHESLETATGYSLHAMGELEYYVISEKEDLFPSKDQKGYHESQPYCKWEALRNDAMRAIASTGGKIKYSHSEVGNFSDEIYNYEQNEIEFLPVPIHEAADQLVVAKWIIRMVAFSYGVTVSFAPKITVGKAGSGMHIHMRLMKDGKSATLNAEGVLSDAAKRAIAGILDLSPSLTAFGNTIPTSYLRLVPHQEAPTNICWGDRNRSVLVRVPLGWTGNAGGMISQANPGWKGEMPDLSGIQTFEFRCPDGSADVYGLLAGLCVAVRHGLEMPDSLEMAKKLYVAVNIFKDEHKDTATSLAQLPASCCESADWLIKQKDVYLQNDVFTDGIIAGITKVLCSYNDRDLSERLFGKHDEIRELVFSHLHCA